MIVLAFGKIYDLKGSTRGRHVQSTGKENEVLLDENLNESEFLAVGYPQRITENHDPQQRLTFPLSSSASTQRGFSAERLTAIANSSLTLTLWTTHLWLASIPSRMNWWWAS